MQSYWPLILILVTGMAGSVLLKKLTLAAAFTGGAIALSVFAGVGYTGIALMATFFIVGTAATSWHKNAKIKIGLSSKKEQQRNAAQVLANAGVAGILGLLAVFFPEQQEAFLLWMAAAFASATADTLSSELGNVYGRRFYNIVTFKQDKKGLDGVVSLEGTAAGLAGSLLIALVYSLGEGWQPASFIIIIAAGTFGNITDSLLGALLERKGLLQNNTVNFLNTLLAALFAAVLYFLLQR